VQRVRIVGRRAVAVESVTRLADFLRLRLAGGHIGGERNAWQCTDAGHDECRTKERHHLLAVRTVPAA